MKKVWTLFFVLQTFFSVIEAQTADWYFIKMPINLLPNLPVNSRKDLVDFYKNDRTAVMPAAFSGEMTLKKLSDDYLFLQTSDVSSLQIKLLPLNDSTKIIAFINTASAPMKNSIIRFYDTNWILLNSINVPKLTCLDFFDAMSSGKEIKDRFEKYCMRLFVELRLEPESNTLTAISSVKEDFKIDFPKEFLPFIKDSIKLSWQRGHF
jgi:hypothetical protein